MKHPWPARGMIFSQHRGGLTSLINVGRYMFADGRTLSCVGHQGLATVLYDALNRAPRREIVPGSAEASDPQRDMQSENHRWLVTMIATARHWTAGLVSGAVADTASLAAREKCSERHIRMVLPLALPAPDIVTAALANRLPPRISISKIWTGLPLAWSEQRALFGVC